MEAKGHHMAVANHVQAELSGFSGCLLGFRAAVVQLQKALQTRGLW